MPILERNRRMGNIIGEKTALDKAVPIICVTILVAFFAGLPSMVSDKNKRLQQAWQDRGCQMYDDYKMDYVPAKCQQFFVDHYAPQQLRSQPDAK